MVVNLWTSAPNRADIGTNIAVRGSADIAIVRQHSLSPPYACQVTATSAWVSIEVTVNVTQWVSQRQVVCLFVESSWNLLMCY